MACNTKMDNNVRETNLADDVQKCTYCNRIQPADKDNFICICDSFKNNKLHWAILSYMNGFSYHKDYYCHACVPSRPYWSEDPRLYEKELVKEADILIMVKADPELALVKNAQDKSPIHIMQELIEILTAQDDLISSLEDCPTTREEFWIKSNLHSLRRIKKGIMDVMDEYAN